MSKQVLVIGGSYFAGRVFSMLATREAGYSLTLVNRGRFSMTHLPNVEEYKCDRHDPEGIASLPLGHFDAVVDFCAYEAGDCRGLLERLPCQFDRYILLSTADVYDRSIRTGKDENTPLLTQCPPCDAGMYMYNKMLLEGEARDACAARGVKLTILRPAFIYGPYNYAPRESWYVEKIVKGTPVPVPEDSDGRFQFVYVKDVANAIIACIGHEQAERSAYNLAGPEILTYRKYMEILAEVSDIPFTTVPVTVEQALRERIPLPFPLTAEEDELYDGSMITRQLGLSYTPFSEGLQRTYTAFKGVYTPR